MSEKELESKCREIRQLQSLIAQAEQEMEALKDDIKAHIGDAEEVFAGEYMVTWKTVTSSRLDSVALRKAMPDIAERFTKVTTCRRFCVR